MTKQQHKKHQGQPMLAAPEQDAYGLGTLNVISNAGKFNRWMYEKIAPHCKGRMLEVGSGIGNISAQFLKEGSSIMLSDIRSDYCKRLEEGFSKFSNLLGVRQINLTDPEFEQNHQPLLGSFDTVFALNVVEHIEDDLLAIRNCRRLLRKGGHLVILVPAFQCLYNGLDLELQHYRRYTIRSLRSVFSTADVQVKHASYFNALGLPAWFISGHIQRNAVISESKMSLFNDMVPLGRLLDSCFNRLLGLSVVLVGEVR